MKAETLRFESGHRFEDNGVFDYELYCPDAGKTLGFTIPHMVARIAGPEKVCPHCMKAIGERATSPAPTSAR